MNKHSILRGALPRRTALVLALGMGVSGLAFGQATTGNVFGQAPAGDTVTVKNTSGMERTVIVGENGHYSITGLPVGTYSVTLQKDGQEVSSRSNITVRVSGGTDVSFATSASAQNLQGLTVTANALPAIDVTSVDSRTVITAQQLKTLPLGRSAEAIALLAPGAIQGSGWFTGPTGNALVSFGGASLTENAYYINGMNVTDPLNGLGGIDLPYGSIEQEEVLTGGYGAAFGRSDGGVINQVGKRGTNEWHFGGQVLWTPTSLRSDPKSIYNPANGEVYQYRNDNKGWNTTYDAYIGGPLIKDKLFMFASVEASKSKDKVVDVVSNGDEYQRTYHDPKWYAKLDWNINDNNILELTGASTEHQYNGNIYDYDNDTHTAGALRGSDTKTKTSAKMWIAKYTTYITDNLTLTAQYGKQKTDLYSEPGGSIDPSIIPISGVDSRNPNYNGGAAITNSQLTGYIDNQAHQTKAANYRIDLTYVLGDHTITAGIDNQRRRI